MAKRTRTHRGVERALRAYTRSAPRTPAAQAQDAESETDEEGDWWTMLGGCSGVELCSTRQMPVKLLASNQRLPPSSLIVACWPGPAKGGLASKDRLLCAGREVQPISQSGITHIRLGASVVG